MPFSSFTFFSFSLLFSLSIRNKKDSDFSFFSLLSSSIRKERWIQLFFVSFFFFFLCLFLCQVEKKDGYSYSCFPSFSFSLFIFCQVEKKGILLLFFIICYFPHNFEKKKIQFFFFIFFSTLFFSLSISSFVFFDFLFSINLRKEGSISFVSLVILSSTTHSLQFSHLLVNQNKDIKMI